MWTRLWIWTASALAVTLSDLATKAAPHAVVLENSRATAGPLLGAIGALLLVLGLWRSRALALGAGIMFGALCGNGGQLLAHGYVTDWLPVGHWMTNLADIAGLGGLVVCAGSLLAHRGSG